MEMQSPNQRQTTPTTYKMFHGPMNYQMPLLVSGKNDLGEQVDVPRYPISVAHTLEKRMNASDGARKAWWNYYFTGDGSLAGKNGDQLIVLGALALYEMTPQSILFEEALVLSGDDWKELKAQKEGVCYLTAKEVFNSVGCGYVKKGGVWTPENKTVAKVWDILSGGIDLKQYIGLVSNASPNSERILEVSLNRTTTRRGLPTMRSFVAYNVKEGSALRGHDGINHSRVTIVGVAREEVE